MEIVKRLANSRLRVTFDERDEIWSFHPDTSGLSAPVEFSSPGCGFGCWWSVEVFSNPGLPSRLPRVIREVPRHRLATNELGCVHRPTPLPDYALIRFGGRVWTHGRALVASDWQFVEGGWARFWRRPLRVSTLVVADRSLGYDRPPLLPKEKYSRLERIMPAAQWAAATARIRELESSLRFPARSSEWRDLRGVQDDWFELVRSLGVSDWEMSELVDRVAELEDPSSPSLIVAAAEWWEDVVSAAPRRASSQRSTSREEAAVEELLGW